MTVRPDPHPVRDFFIHDLIDYAPKDSAEMMERPFFSISKRKRNKPIEYKSPDGNLWIKVSANPLYGMATIWDADILIWCISRIVQKRESGMNDPTAIIHTTPHELLRGIARETGGRDYAELMNAIMRLRTTQIETNIRAGNRRYVGFHYLGDIEGSGDASDDPLKVLSLRVPEWLLEGIMKGSVLTLDREYFLMTGGIERAIYRAARKHAGAQKQGWTCRVSVLHEKTGSESSPRLFAFKLRELCARDALPRYAMRETRTQDGQAAVHFVDRQFIDAAAAEASQAKAAQFYREDARAAWIDAGRHPRKFEPAWDAWAEAGRNPADFAAACQDKQAALL